MLCALEVKEKRMCWEVEEEIRLEKERLEEEKIRQETAKRSIEFAETTIAKFFEDYANGKNDGIYKLHVYCKEKDTCYVLVKGTEYADRYKESRVPSKIYYSYNALKEYLEAHCYKVELENHGFWWYNCGWFDNGYDITVRIPKNLPCD